MDWAESNGEDYIFGLPGNAVLDALAAETAARWRAQNWRPVEADHPLEAAHAALDAVDDPTRTLALAGFRRWSGEAA